MADAWYYTPEGRAGPVSLAIFLKKEKLLPRPKLRDLYRQVLHSHKSSALSYNGRYVGVGFEVHVHYQSHRIIYM